MKCQYYVVTEEEAMDQKIIAIHVTNAEYFDQNRCQSDQIDAGVVEAVINGGFQAGELMEGVIEVNGATKEAVEAHLKTIPEFDTDDDFSDFINSFANLDC